MATNLLLDSTIRSGYVIIYVGGGKLKMEQVIRNIFKVEWYVVNQSILEPYPYPIQYQVHISHCRTVLVMKMRNSDRARLQLRTTRVVNPLSVISIK